MMGRRTERKHLSTKSHTLPSSPTYSSSSSDFEFTISLSPRKSSATLCPADELFYKGQLLPLHISPRLSMVRTLLLASSSTSSSTDTTTTASRDSHSSTESHSSTSSDLLLLHHLPDCDSSRPSSATDDEFKRLTTSPSLNYPKKSSKYFSLSRFSSVFRKEPKNTSSSSTTPSSSVKRVSSSAKEVIRKYLKKVKPLYEKLSQKHQQKVPSKPDGSIEKTSQISAHEYPRKENANATVSHSFSGNLRYPRRRNCIASSCPSSMRSSPSHSGIISKNGFTVQPVNGTREAMYGYSESSSSSMEELQSAIQGAIAHCKSSMNKTGADYVNSSVVEAVEVRSSLDGFMIKMRDGRHLRCVHNNPQGGHLPDYAPHPAIILKMEDGTGLLLPIIVLEMQSVLLMAAVRNVQIPRPTAYEVVKDMIEKMGYTVKLVRVTKRVHEAYFAELQLVKLDNEAECLSFDLRPSDAINIAVRCKVPIQVNKYLAYGDGMRVIESAKVSVQSSVSDCLLFTELDRPTGQPCIETEEFNLVRNMLIAAVEERYRDAALLRDRLTQLRSKRNWT